MRGSDTTGLDDSSLDTEHGELVPAVASTSTSALEEPLVQPGQRADTRRSTDETNAPADLPRPESADEALTRQVQVELMLRCGRQRGRVITGLQAHVVGSTTLIVCATFDDMGIVQNEMIGAIQRILMQLGAAPQIVFTTRAGWEARNAGAGNARGRPAATDGLPSTA